MLIHETPQRAAPNIKKVLDLVIDKSPCMVTADISTVYMWVNEGCLIEDDILPTMEEIFKKKKGIRTFSYFTNAVLAARDKRGIAKTITKKNTPDPLLILKSWAWKRGKGIYLSKAQEDELDAYEAKNGRFYG